MNKKHYLFILLIICFGSATSQIPDFYREDLFFVLDDNSLHVSGDYYFNNPHEQPIKIALAYPFPQDKVMGKVTNVYSFDKNSIFQEQLFRYNQRAARIKLFIRPSKSTILRIGYTQEIHSNKAIYILTTTAAWGKPFQQAYYELHVPFDINIDSLSYTPDKIQQVGGLYIYIFERNNFMPDRDFEIYFSK
mgnify:CR=1 FL=1